MPKTQHLLFGTFLLTAAGLTSRIIGFFYRIFLSHAIGAQGLGIYQLTTPFLTLAYAFTVMGLQTALSKSISGKLAVHDRNGARNLLVVGGAVSLVLSAAAAFILYQGSSWFSLHILREAACIPLLQLMALTIPFGTLHICIVSYYFACQNTWIPSVGQLLEQIFRVLSSWLFYQCMIKHAVTPGPLLAIAGITAAELASLTFTLFFLTSDFKRNHFTLAAPALLKDSVREILRHGAPLTANRVILNLMRSAESALIPLCLKRYGMSSFQALSLYGVLTGMALPLVLFPSTITHSVSIMLLPSVAQSNALHRHAQIAYTTEKTIRYGLFLGILCFGIFFLYGDSMGRLLFHNAQAGSFITAFSFLCPFLYLSTTLASILNGLGKTTYYFIQSLTGLTVRIAFVIFFIPRFGIAGYLWGILANEMLLVLLSLAKLHRERLLIFSAKDCLLKPFCFLVLAAGCSFFVRHLTAPLSLSLLTELIVSCAVVSLTYFLLLLVFHLVHLPKILTRLYFSVDKE